MKLVGVSKTRPMSVKDDEAYDTDLILINQTKNSSVDITVSGRVVAVRDIKRSRQNGPVLFFDILEWRHFIDLVKAGEFDI